MTTDTRPTPTIERVRHELRRRTLTVTQREELGPHMLRFTLTSPDLDSFVSVSCDDHIKLFLTDAAGETVMREYTPRAYDTEARTLVLDFALHDAGPATQWAIDAQIGSQLTIGGPRGSRVIKGVQNWLLIGDETALPAIGRRIEELAPGDHATALITVCGAEDEQQFTSAGTQDIRYIHRPETEADKVEPFLAALADLELAEDTFVWVAAEAYVARALRAHFLDAGLPKVWLKTAGYWTRGQADASEKPDD